jgi:hypothetical protein
MRCIPCWSRLILSSRDATIARSLAARSPTPPGSSRTAWAAASLRSCTGSAHCAAASHRASASARSAGFTCSDKASTAAVITWACSTLIRPPANAVRVGLCCGNDLASCTSRTAAPGAVPPACSQAAVLVAPSLLRAALRSSISAMAASLTATNRDAVVASCVTRSSSSPSPIVAMSSEVASSTTDSSRPSQVDSDTAPEGTASTTSGLDDMTGTVRARADRRHPKTPCCTTTVHTILRQQTRSRSLPTSHRCALRATKLRY